MSPHSPVFVIGAYEETFLAPKRLTCMKDSALKAFRILSLAFVLTLLSLGHVAAAPIPATEKQKIETLIREVNDLKEASFIRNGSTYNSGYAATFLRRKWQANHSEVKSARDFINKVASISGTSGKPYLIRFKDGKEIYSRDFLLAKLKSLEG
jgi:hypothetical protein